MGLTVTAQCFPSLAGWALAFQTLFELVGVSLPLCEFRRLPIETAVQAALLLHWWQQAASL